MSNNNDNVAHAGCVETEPALILDAPAIHLHASVSFDVYFNSVEADKGDAVPRFLFLLYLFLPLNAKHSA